MPYIPLHVHSVNSPHHGMMTPSDIVARASFLKYPAIALTDRWTSYGHSEFYRLARGAGINPVLGAEIQHLSLTGGRGGYHLTLLAENTDGYRNLLSLISKHYEKEKYNYVSEQELVMHREGLIVLSGCINGEANQAVLHGNLGRERAVVEKLLQIYGKGNVFLELMNHNGEKEQFVMDQMILLARKLKVPMVVTNNDRFIDKEQAEYYSVLRKLDSSRNEYEDEQTHPQHFMKRQKDLEPYFYGLDEALEMSERIAERCSVELEFSKSIAFTADVDELQTLSEMCERRFLLKFHNAKADESKVMKSVLRDELVSAEREKLSGFLLFLRRLFRICAAKGVKFEIVGSDVLESFIAYLLGIIPLDPLEHGLIFESFGSSGPGVPPQIEFIKAKGTRERFLSILDELLPRNKVFNQVVREEMSFMTLVREICDALEVRHGLREQLDSIISSDRRKATLHERLENSEVLTRLFNTDEVARKVLKAAHSLMGMVHHFNLNTSKLVILPEEADRYTAWMTGPGGEKFLLVNAAAIEWMGGWTLILQKSHFLSALDSTIRLIEREGTLLMPSTPGAFDDGETFEMISSGDTTGVYLLESKGIRDLLTKIRPSDFNELVNVISLYRPAPLEGKLWQKYIENADKKGKVFLPHHSMAATLEATRGLLLYGEQVREIMRYSAGLSGETAAGVEKALKNVGTGDLLNARLRFIRGAMDNGIDEEKAQQIFDFLLHNIKYTYDKAFSSSQAYITYRTAYLKAHFPVEYFTSLLNSTSDVRDRQRTYLDYLESINRQVFPADINSSSMVFTREEGGIRSPLNESNQLDDAELEKVIGERDSEGRFDSMENFLERMFSELPMSSVNNLIDAGLFDFLVVSRAELREECLAFYEKHARAGDFFRPPAQQAKKKSGEAGGQLSFFDDEQDLE